MANILNSSAAGIGKLLAFLTNILDNVSEAEAFINLLGWRLPAAVNDIGLTSLELGEFIEKLELIIDAPEEEWEDELLMLERIADLILSLNALVQQITDTAESLPLSADYLSKTNIHKDLPRRLFDLLVCNYVSHKNRFAFALMHLINVIEYRYFEADDDIFQIEHVRAIVNFDKYKTLITDPAGLFEETYGWNTSTFNAKDLFKRISLLFDAMGLSTRLQQLNQDTENVFTSASPGVGPLSQLNTLYYEELGNITGLKLGFSLLELRSTSAGNNDAGFAIIPIVKGKLDASIPFFAIDDTFINISGDGDALKRAALKLRPTGAEIKTANGISDVFTGKFTIGILHGLLENDPKPLITFPGGSVLKIQQISLTAGMEKYSDLPAESTIELGFLGGNFILNLDQADNFLSSTISSENVEANFDLTIGWSSKNGIFFHGSGGLELAIPLNIDFGFINLETLFLGVSIDGEGLEAEASTSGSLALGPLVATIDRIGLDMDISFGEGNLGLFGLSPSFKPPNGVGLSIDAGAVKGGGYLFFDHDREEYAGALELIFSEWIALKAIGLITTKLPDGSKGFSLLIIITVEFGTGIQLGFGFTLLGVGGLLGLNRTVNIEPLKEGVRSNAIDRIMFPEDVVANAPKIISDLRKFFPPAKDIFLIGPMAKISWGTPALVNITLGVILEFPAVNITILGVVKVALPDENADILRLQVNFIGRVEPSNKLLWFYAELYDSRVLFITLEGGMGLLLNWGDNANFVFSVGGFHPKYNPPPLPFNVPPRLAISLFNESWLKLRAEGYFAVTSNTVQFGARVELYVGISAFNIDGHFAMDVLFQFNPFFFIFELSVSLSVKLFGFGLFSVGFSGLVEGPTPWHIKGKGKIGFWFFSVSVPFEHSWGDTRHTELPPIRVFPLIKKEFEALTNWEGVLPRSSSILVALRKLGESPDAEDQLVLHPVGLLRISQRKIPLKLVLDKVGNQRPDDVNKLSVTAEITGGSILSTVDFQEQFATGEFKDLDNAAKLSDPGFKKYDSGVDVRVAGEQLRTGQAVKRIIRYETIIIDNNFKRFRIPFFKVAKSLFASFGKVMGTLFGHFIKGSSVSKSVLSKHYQTQIRPNEVGIQIRSNLYSVAHVQNNTPVVDNEGNQMMYFTSQANAEDYLQEQISKNPNLVKQLHVIPNPEVIIAA